MARLIPIEINGKLGWVPDDPDVCPNRHTGPRREWGPCPGCGTHITLWRCEAEGCGAVDVDDHRCD